jgi:hypothetical protein
VTIPQRRSLAPMVVLGVDGRHLPSVGVDQQVSPVSVPQLGFWVRPGRAAAVKSPMI